MQKALAVSLFLALVINLFFLPFTSKDQKILDTNCREGGYNYLTHKNTYYYETRCPRGYLTKRTPVWVKTPSTYEINFLLLIFQVGVTGAVFMSTTFLIYSIPDKKKL